MTTLIRVVIGVLLFAHGLVHPLSGSRCPRVLAGSILAAAGVGEQAGGNGPDVGDGGGLRAARAGSAGAPGISGMWPAIAVVASALSLALMVALWSWSLVFGVLIDLALIAVAVIRPEWTDAIGG